jgi:hypothetical protein
MGGRKLLVQVRLGATRSRAICTRFDTEFGGADATYTHILTHGWRVEKHTPTPATSDPPG